MPDYLNVVRRQPELLMKHNPQFSLTSPFLCYISGKRGGEGGEGVGGREREGKTEREGVERQRGKEWKERRRGKDERENR